MTEISPATLEALLSVLEAAVRSIPHIIEAIETHGSLDDSQRASLLSRAAAARSKVDGYLAKHATKAKDLDWYLEPDELKP